MALREHLTYAQWASALTGKDVVANLKMAVVQHIAGRKSAFDLLSIH
jgi:predicted transcriptional regulator